MELIHMCERDMSNRINRCSSLEHVRQNKKLPDF